MKKPALPHRCFVIAQPGLARDALVDGLKQDGRFEVQAVFAALHDAYSKTEESPPDITICSRTVSAQAEFHMFKAMLVALGKKMIVINKDQGLAGVLRALNLPATDVPPATLPRPAPLPDGQARRLIVIGASTGGIEALSQILSRYPENCPPTLIVQHIQAGFDEGIVMRLNRASAARVVVARDGMPIASGTIALSPAGHHLEVGSRGRRCHLIKGPPENGHCPSVDRLFRSAASLGERAVGVILTGMGRDGADGLLAMRRAGAWTIGQDASTSVVYGMPRVAQERNALSEILPLPKICAAILRAATCKEEIAQ